MTRHPARSRRDGRRPRHPDELRGAEALPPDPRPPHGRLGDRDRARGRRRPARRRRLARRRATSSPTAASTVAVQEQPLGTGDAVRSARDALGGHDGDVLVLSGDTPLLTPRAARASSSTTHRPRAARRRRSSAPSRRTRASTGAIVRDADGAVLRDRRGHRRDAGGAARSARSTRRSTSSARDALWPALEQLQPKNVQGELYLTDAIEILVARRRARSPRTSPPTRARPTA